MTSMSALHRDYTFLGTTQSLCPECLAVVPAKIIERGGRVYFRKTCPEHGVREDFVCSRRAVVRPDGVRAAGAHARRVRRRAGQGLPARLRPVHRARAAHLRRRAGDHVVVQSDLPDVLCRQRPRRQAPFAGRLPSGRSIGWSRSKGGPKSASSPAASRRSIRSLREIVEYALSREIDYVMINTNGIRFARDPALVELAARHQATGWRSIFSSTACTTTCIARCAASRCWRRSWRRSKRWARPACTSRWSRRCKAGVNDDQMGPLVEFGLARPWITGISFQPATYSGRHVLPEQLGAADHLSRCDRRASPGRPRACSAKTTSCRCRAPIPTAIRSRLPIAPAARRFPSRGSSTPRRTSTCWPTASASREPKRGT